MMAVGSRSSVQQIRVLLYCAAPEIRTDLQRYLRDPDRYPIWLAETVDDDASCRRAIRELFPNVVVLVDMSASRASSEALLQLARDINLDYRNVATVFLAANPDSNYLLRALHSGAKDVVPIEQIDVGLSATLGGEVERAIMQAFEFVRLRGGHQEIGNRVSRARTVGFFSGKGGVGKSTLAAAFATELATEEAQRRVVLADYNLQFGDLAAILGQRPATSIANIAKLARELTIDEVQEYLTEVRFNTNSRLFLLPAPQAITDMPVIQGEAALAVLTGLQRFGDYLVVDLPSHIDEASMTVLRECDLLYVVTQAEMLAIRATRRFLSTLRMQQDLPSRMRIHLIVNQTQKGNAISASDVNQLFSDLSTGGSILSIPKDDEYVQQQVMSGSPLGGNSFQSPFCEALRRLTWHFLGREVPSPTKKLRRSQQSTQKP